MEFPQIIFDLTGSKGILLSISVPSRSQAFQVENYFEDIELFLGGIFAPEERASFKAMAIACLRLFTFFPEEDFSVPLLNSSMTLLTFFSPFVLEELLLLEFDFCLVGI